MVMGGANFGRHLAYWLYCYELLKVAKLVPAVIEKDFGATQRDQHSIQV